MSKKNIFKLVALAAYCIGLYAFGRRIERLVDDVVVSTMTR